MHLGINRNKLKQNIEKGWGLARLFNHYKEMHEYHGETLILREILVTAKGINKIFPRKTINYVFREYVEEDLNHEQKKPLLDFGREPNSLKSKSEVCIHAGLTSVPKSFKELMDEIGILCLPI